MKLDKDTVLKQRFWFLLPLILVLIFLALGSVWSLSSQADQMNEEVKKQYDQITKGGGVPVTQKLLELLRKEHEKARELRWSMWTLMFNMQNDVVVEDGHNVIRRYWIRVPEPLAELFSNRDFGEPFAREEFPHNDFRSHFPRLYESLLNILPLYDEKTGRGAVRVAPVIARAAPGPGGDQGDSSGPGFAAHAAGIGRSTRQMMLELLEPITFGEGNLTVDEIWYALEEVSVKWLLLEALREVLDEFAILKPEFLPLAVAELGASDDGTSEKSPTKPNLLKPGGVAPATGPAKVRPMDTGPVSSSEKLTSPEVKTAQKTAPPQESSKPNQSDITVPDRKISPEKPGHISEKSEPAKTAPRQLIVQQRFYNTVWHYEILAADLTEADVQKPLPVLDRNEGWLLDVRVTAELSADNKPKQYFLEIVSQNYSPRYDIPKMPVRVWLETTGGKRIAVDVPDAGSVPKAPLEPGKAEHKPVGPTTVVPSVPKPSERVVEPIPIRLPAVDGAEAKEPDSVDAILGVQRMLSGKQVLDYQRFANDHWVMDIQVQRARTGIGYELAGQIYNRSGRRQVPPAFEVVLWSDSGRGESQEMRREFRPIKKPVDAFHAEKFEEGLGILANEAWQLGAVKQILDWQTTPIKRLDVLCLGERALAQADRLWTMPLIIYPFHLKAQNRSDILDFSPPIRALMGGSVGGFGGTGLPPGGAPPGNPGGQSAGGGSAPGGMDVSVGAGQQQPGAGFVSRNNIPLRRYLPANPSDTNLLPNSIPEVRRLPVALVLIVDYSAIPDILVSLANSPLRIQVTQAVFSRYPPLGPPPAPAGGKPLGGVSEVAPPNPGSAGDAIGSESAEHALVELQVFGVASIYENPYLSHRWQSTTAPGGGGPGSQYGPPPGGSIPVKFRPMQDNRGRGPSFGPGRRGSGRGRR